MQNNFFDIERETKSNTDYRRVLFTGPHHQLVLMSLKPQEEIGEEAHSFDQFIRIEAGTGQAVLNGETYDLEEDTAFIIPEGTRHNVKNTSSADELKLYTVYSTAAHPDKTVHRTKAESIEEEGH